MIRNPILLLVLLCLFMALAPAAHAACTSPAANVGGKHYVYASHKFQYCDGTNWNDMPISGTDGTCTTEAQWNWNNGLPDYEYCNATNWRKLACAIGVANCNWSTSPQTRITASDGSSTYDMFGHSVAVYGTIAVVGADYKTVGANGQQGAAYIFDISNPAAPVQKAIIHASDGTASDYFGHSVAVYGNIAVIGASQKTVGANTAQGAVYIFDISNPALPVQKSKITSSDGAAYDMFGDSVAVYGNLVLIGADWKVVSGHSYQGSVYVFDITNPLIPVQDAAITDSVTGAINDYFGYSVSLSGNLAVIGAAQKTVGAAGQGEAYVYDVTTPTAPVKKATFVASDGLGYDYFGTSVSLSGSTALVGAYGWSNGNDTGAAYVFDLTNPASPVQKAKITDSGGATFNYFGQSVSLSGNTAVIGDYEKTVSGHSSAGAAFVYDLTTPASPVLEATLTASDNAVGDYFGYSVAATGSTAVVGAYYKTIGANMEQGAVYIFYPTCTAGGCATNGACTSTYPEAVAGSFKYACAPGAWSNGQNASDALGQFASTSSDATVVYTTGGANNNNGTTVGALGFSRPYAAALDPVNHRLFVAEYTNSRVLVYNLNTDNSIPASPGHTATYVLGQPSFTTNTLATTQSGMWKPMAVAFDATNNRLFVADQINNRVLVYNTATITNGMNASYELGQPAGGTQWTSSTAATTQSGMHFPGGLAYDATNNRLFVGDFYSGRVLVFNVDPGTIANGENASYELGETSFTSLAGGRSQSLMWGPNDVAYDAANSRLFVVDGEGGGNDRVMVFNVAPGTIANFENASFELGQPSGTAFTSNTAATSQSGLNQPEGVAFNPTNNNLFVGDYLNNRVMVFNVAPGTIANGENASYELGQPSGTAFTTATVATSQSGMYYPASLAFDATNNRLFVADSANNRVLEYTAPAGACSFEYCDGTNWIPVVCGTPSLSFTPQTGVALSTLATSNIAAASGVTCDNTAVSISGASGSPQYRICADAACSTVVQTWGSTAGTTNPGQYLQQELTSSASSNTTNSATLTVGGTGTAWNVTTCTLPSFVFTNQTNVATSTLTTSNILQLDSSTCSPTTVSAISGTGSPQFRICSDAACGTVLHTWGTASQSMSTGQYLQLELTSSASYNTANSATVTVGGVAQTAWSVTTWLGYQRVFVSSVSTYTGQLSATAGVAAADADCAGLATAAGLSGTWKAWIAVTSGTDTPGAAGRFTHPTTPYKLVDGTTTIANNWTGLASGTHLAGISKDQTGTTVSAGNVWTNVAATAGANTASVSGSNSAGNCSAWTITGTGIKKGWYGLSGSATTTWTASSSQTCSSTAHLYCFEQ